MKLAIFICGVASQLLSFGAQPLVRPVSFDIAASGHSSTPVLTSDGQHLLFISDAPNVAPEVSGNGWTQLYIRNLTDGTTILVTANQCGAPVTGNCALASVSANGQFVAFLTDAPDVVGGDTNGVTDLFVRDIQAETTRWITHSLGGEVPLYWRQRRVETALFSQDGEWLFFDSLTSDLTPDVDTNGVFDVFAHHRPSGTNLLVVKSATNLATPTNGARLVSATPDGKRVLYFIPLVPSAIGDLNLGCLGLFALDLQTGENLRVSELGTYLPSDYNCSCASISEDGQVVALTATASGYPGMLFRRILGSGVTELIASNITANVQPQISTDGSVIIFEDGTNVYRWSSTGTQVVNVRTNGTAAVTGVAKNSRMTPNGQQVCFASDSPGLTTNSPGGVFQVYCRDFVSGETWLVTQTTAGVPSAYSAESSAVDIARDGALVAFDAPGSDLAAGDLNRATDVFIRTHAAAATLISSNNGTARQTALGNALLTSLSVSSNGVHVAFLSGDSTVLNEEGHPLQNASAADLSSGTVVSAGATNACRAVAISANGRYLLTRGAAPRESAPPYSTNMIEIRRHDLATRSIQVIHRQAEQVATDTPAISPDGNSVAYITGSSLKLYNISTATEEFAFGPQVSPFLHTRSDALFSADGRFVLFQSSSNGLELRLYDRTTRQTETIPATGGAFSANSRFLVCPTNGWPFDVVLRRDLLAQTTAHFKLPGFSPNTISDDGRFVVGTFGSNPASREQQILLLDWETRATNILSVSASGELGIGRSQWPAISANGRYVAYSTDAANIVPGNAPFRQQAVLRDVLLGTTTLLSAATNGEPGNAFSSRPILSADGRTIVFQSMASNLTPGDYNNARDIFIVKIGDADTDGDGMDDDWEVAFFGNMTRNGSADFDGDGITDGAEFLAGTDPTNGNSVFRVMIMARLGDSWRTVLWSGSPGRGYQVEYKDELCDSDWKVLPASPVWVGNTARAEDPAPGSSRFYRVVRRP